MLVEASPIGLLLMVDGKVKYSNPGVLDLMGIRMEDELYDEHFVSLFHEDDQAVLQEDIRLVEVGERPPYREVRIRVSDDEVVEVGVRMTLSFHDRSPAVQVTLTDLRTRVALIREQMRAEERVKAATKAADTTAKALASARASRGRWERQREHMYRHCG